MASINKTMTAANVQHTHEGAVAHRISPVQELRRTLLACMLWEDGFYEDGASIAERIVSLVAKVKPQEAHDLAIEARGSMKLRHAPLLVVREMARLKGHAGHVRSALSQIIQRPDELTEFVALYWKEKREPLSSAVKKGLADAFGKFSEYQLAKYNRDGAVKLRDVLFLCHAKPKNEEQAAVWKRLVDGQLATPDTWEVALSSGADKKATWERLIAEKKLGALALLRNLRNMAEAKVNEDAIRGALVSLNAERVLPFRFLAAARHAPVFEPQLEQAMFRCLEGVEKLKGETILLVDTSGSMDAKLSAKSDLNRLDAAKALAILLREVCESVRILAFEESARAIPPRRGFALGDAIGKPGGGTRVGASVEQVNKFEKPYTRIIVITDEQSRDTVPNPKGKGYMVNVGSNKNGVGYGQWTNITGFSESIVSYIMACEAKDSP